MKKALICILLILCSLPLLAKDFHFVYIRFDFSMEKQILLQQIMDLKSNLSDDTDFVVYYSNEQILMNKTSWNYSELASYIAEQMQYSELSISDECNLICESLEKYASLDVENQRVVSLNNTTNVILDCFVGNEFIYSNYQEYLFAHLLIGYDFENSDVSICMNFYPCNASYNEENLQIKPLYQLNIQPKIIR